MKPVLLALPICTIILALINSIGFAQNILITGFVKDSVTGKAISGATVFLERNATATSDSLGKFQINSLSRKCDLNSRMIGYKPFRVTLVIDSSDNLKINILLIPENLTMKEVVVSSAKCEQQLKDVCVSMFVLNAKSIADNNATGLDKALEQVPAVNVMDAQANIRSGSGFSKGAGSRVMVLINDMPLLAADADDVKWSSLPIENLDKVEIVKASSSALFGSGALNGVINLRMVAPAEKHDSHINIFAGVYDIPKNKSQKWWGKNDVQSVTGLTFSGRKKFTQLDLIIGGMMLNDKGFKQGNFENRYRINADLKYHFKKIKGLSLCAFTNYQKAENSSFTLWENDSSGAYRPYGGYDTLNQNIAYTQRFNFDPVLTYKSEKLGSHILRSRYYATNYKNSNDESSTAESTYIEYQFQKLLFKKLTLTCGYVFEKAVIASTLYENHHTSGNALYLQSDYRLKKWYLSFGIRIENNIADDSLKLNYKPVVRAGINYQVYKNLNIRASYGQGYRFPSIAERFINSDINGLPIYPNPGLKTEYGWTSEIGLQQQYSVSKLSGYFDIAFFQMQFRDMIEFEFSNFGPNQYGFQSQNIGNTKINGIDFTWMNGGFIKKIPVNIMTGYTYTIPIQTDFDSASAVLNSSDKNILKYRNQQLVKADVETGYKKFTIGTLIRFYSPVENMDKIIEIFVPGLEHYNDTHTEGDWIIDGRIFFQYSSLCKVGFNVKNIFNHFYTARPADAQPMRFYNLQWNVTF